MEGLIDTPRLIELAAAASTITQPCDCLARDLLGWSNWPVGLREERFVAIATLAKYAPEDAIIEEYHPHGTWYWSPDAPIAPRYYPYNQCGVWRCCHCSRLYLRHNDDGAYHVERRIRRLTPTLIIDAPHPTDGQWQKELT